MFGCDRERPLVRRDNMGLLWLVKGGTVRELRHDGAIIEAAGGAGYVFTDENVCKAVCQLNRIERKELIKQGQVTLYVDR